MSPDDKKAVTCDKELEAGIGSDPEFVQALLGIYHHIELGDLFESLLHFAAKWSAAEAGIAYGLTEARRAYVPLAGTMPPDDPRFKSVHALIR